MAAKDDEQVDTERSRELAKERSDKLKAAGFDPGVPYHQIAPRLGHPTPRVSLFLDALKDSVYWRPRAIELVHRPGDIYESLIPVVPELVEVLYKSRTFGLYPGELPFGCWDEPDWYVRGHLLRSSFGPQLPHFVVHLYLVLLPKQTDEVEQIYMQLVDQPSGADPRTELVESPSPLGLD